MALDLEQSLLSLEKLDRASPDIWPERNCKIPLKYFIFSGWMINTISPSFTCLDPDIGFNIEPLRSPEVAPNPPVVPQEMDKHDFTLIGSECLL